MGLFDFLFGGKKSRTRAQEKHGLDDLDRQNREHIAANPELKDDEDALMREASSALTAGDFSKSLAIYSKMAELFPEKKGLYLSQVGANHYFMGNYDTAIETYVLSREHGMDASMIDENIWEACEQVYKEKNDPAIIESYLKHCSDGSFIKQANKILGR